MKYIIDKNNIYIGFGGSKTELKEGQNEVPFAPSSDMIKAFWNGTSYDEVGIYEVTVPNEVPLWCIKALLNEMGLLEIVDGALTQLEEPMKSRANYIWNYGNIIKRDSQTVEFIGVVLQKNKIEIDEIFINANKIEL